MRSTQAGEISRLQIASRVAASLVGGYAFVWGLISLGTVAGVAAGWSYETAHTWLVLVAFLVFLTAMFWTFVTRSALRAWVLLAGGGAAMTALAWAWSSALS